MEPRKLPVGIQNFQKLREEGCIYIDKTAYIYRLARISSPYFLGRPRRFGKSLLLSTMKAYFEGRRELFEGLAVAGLETDWTAYPVFHLDMNNGDYSTAERAESSLGSTLHTLEEDWGIVSQDEIIPKRFESLIRRVCEKTGKQVVVLIDEYDKPLLTRIEEGAIDPAMPAIFKGFYGTLKTADAYLRFVFLTGVTKFSQVSVFSDLNQLIDISLVDEYAAICGITETELVDTFPAEFDALAEKNEMTREEAIAKTRKRYDGYHFSKAGKSVYNPFSVMKTLMFRDFGDYWFESGTPTFLIKLIQRQRFEIPELSSGILATANSIVDYRMNNGGSLIPLLYQSGYLTIKRYHRDIGAFTLAFPNEEVEFAFLEVLLNSFFEAPPDYKGLAVFNFMDDLKKGDVEGFMTRMKALVEDLQYPVCGRPPRGVKKSDLINAILEQNVQNVFYLAFTLMGKYVQAEARSVRGRCDVVAVSSDTVYVFEFKTVKNAAETPRENADAAMSQIDEKGYALPWQASGKTIVKVAARYNLASRTIDQWNIAGT